MRADELTVADVLEDIDGNPIVIIESRTICLDRAVPVYDIRVRGQHTFFAGERRILVHNS